METRTRKFSLFFSLRINHAWFGGAACPYISLEPDADCRVLLARRKLLCKEDAGGLQVIAEASVDGEKPAPVQRKVQGPVAPDHYRFLIRLKDMAFFAVTRMDLADYPGQLFCFSNTAKNTRLSVKKYQNPGRNKEAILGMVDISLAGSSPGKGSQETFLLSFEAI